MAAVTSVDDVVNLWEFSSEEVDVILAGCSAKRNLNLFIDVYHYVRRVAGEYAELQRDFLNTYDTYLGATPMETLLADGGLLELHSYLGERLQSVIAL